MNGLSEVAKPMKYHKGWTITVQTPETETTYWLWAPDAKGGRDHWSAAWEISRADGEPFGADFLTGDTPSDVLEVFTSYNVRSVFLRTLHMEES